MQPNERFWNKVSKIDNACWQWIAGKNQDGYGRFRINGSHRQAHHVSWFLKHGQWPKYIMHSCDNPGCVNPDHLAEGTHKQNIQDAVDKGRFFGGSALYKNEVPRIRDLLRQGISNTAIAKWLNIDQSIISRIKNKKIYARIAA